MKYFRIVISFFMLLFACNNLLAQTAGNARISKISFIFAMGNKNVQTFSYDEKNRIKEVAYLMPNSSSISVSFTDFKFDNNNRPVAYKINYVREGGTGDVSLRYDGRGRLLELLRRVDGVTYSFNYTYNSDGGFTELQKQTSETTFSNNRFVFYTEDGDYREIYSDIPNKTVIGILKISPGRTPSAHPAEMLGGFQYPTFMGIQGVSNSGDIPRIADTKDANGLTVLRTITVSGNPTLTKIAYEYAAKPVKIDTKKDSIKVNIPIPAPKQATTTTFITNADCLAGENKIKAILQQQQGISSVGVNIDNGWVSVAYFKDVISAEKISQLINEAGFNTGKKNSVNPSANPCIRNFPKPDANTPQTAVIPKNIPPEVKQLKVSTVKGKLLYRYRNDNEAPLSKPIIFPAADPSKKAIPYPEYIGGQRFAKTAETKPLKGVRVFLAYQTVSSVNKVPLKFEDLVRDMKPSSNEWVYDNYKMSATNYIVGEGITDATGNFSITFINNLYLGFLSKFAESHVVATKAGDGSHTINDTKESSAGDFYMHGTLRLIVDKFDYCSPDIMLFPEPGKTVQLPEEIAFVNSFNLSVKVMNNDQLDQAVNTSIQLSNFPVKIGSTEKFNPIAPVEGPASGTNPAGLTFENIPLRVIEGNVTDATGTYLFRNLCKSKTHVLQAVDAKYDGSLVYEAQDLNLKADRTYQPETYYKFVTGDYRKYDTLIERGRFNSEHVPQTVFKTLILAPRLPELYVRSIVKVKAETVGLDGVKVRLQSTSLFNPYVDYTTAGGGYVQQTDLALKNAGEDGKPKKLTPGRRLILSKPGYKTAYFPTNGSYDTVRFGQRWPKPTEILMTGSGAVSGNVKNEKNERIACDIRVADGPYVKTITVFGRDGYFYIDNCASGKKVPVEIVPSTDQYFPEIIQTDIAAGATTMMGTVVLKEKLHRVIFKIVDENNKPVGTASVMVNKNVSVWNTDGKGTTQMIEISSPGDEFPVKVSAPGFVDYEGYETIPISKTAKPVTITMVRGMLISGYVTDSKTKKPIDKARVYTVSGSNEDGEIQVETYTDAKGHYELRGIPVKGHFLNGSSMTVSSAKLTVYAVRTGKPAYIRGEAKAYSGKNGDVNLELQPFECNAEIWGLPVEISSAEPKKGSTNVIISGAFVNIPGNAAFKMASEHARLPFTAVEVKILQPKEIGGDLNKNFGAKSCSMEPLADAVTTDASMVKILVYDKFNADLSGAAQGRGYENLMITKTKVTGCGVLKGYVTTSLESFNFSYAYNGSFTLQNWSSNPLKNYSTKMDMLEVAAAGNCISTKEKYRLAADPDRNNFIVHNFDASFRGSDSYVVRDTFSLGADINLDIPLVKATALNAGAIKVLQNNIIWNDFKGPIRLDIEKWNISGTGLTYNKNKGGFEITDPKLQTNLPELALKSIVIEPHDIQVGEDNIDPGAGVMLAGIAKMELNKVKPGLLLDPVAPHDHKPHWRLNLVGSGKEPVAYLRDLPGIGDAIAIDYLSDYSDGKKTVRVNAAYHPFYNVLSQQVNDIEIGKNSFILLGTTDLLIPGSSGFSGRLKYMIENGKLVCNPEILRAEVELAGGVSFAGGQSLKDFELRDKYFSSKGKATIYDKGGAIVLDGTIIKDGSITKLDLKAGQALPIATGKQRMNIEKGTAQVAGAGWNNLKFTTILEGYEVVKKGQDKLDFEVKGALRNDPDGQKLQLEDLQTPFGGMEISFDFARKIFFGSLKIDAPLVLPPGLFTINTGKASVQLDDKGLIVTGAFSDVRFSPLSVLGPFQAGLALGYYAAPLPIKMANDLKAVTVRKSLPSGMDKELKGIYISLSRQFHYDISVPGADKIPLPPKVELPNASIDAGLDICALINLGNGGKVFADGYGFVKAKASVACFSLSLDTKINPAFSYDNDTKIFTLASDQSIGLNIGACGADVGMALGLKIGIVNNELTVDPSIKLK